MFRWFSKEDVKEISDDPATTLITALDLLEEDDGITIQEASELLRVEKLVTHPTGQHAASDNAQSKK